MPLSRASKLDRSSPCFRAISAIARNMSTVVTGSSSASVFTSLLIA